MNNFEFSISNLTSYVKSSLPFTILRNYKYKFRRKNLRGDKHNLSDMRSILVDELGLKAGDSLVIHCGFGFLNADYDPEQLIELLKDVVGERGRIMMPFYPPGLSRHWLQSNRVFDATSVRCSTGVLAQVFSQSEDVVISTHPIKAVAVWGSDAEEIVQGHEHCQYPYDERSPYYKFSLQPKSKVIGLGVRNCSLVHMLEDVFEDNKSYLYSDETVQGRVVTHNGTLIVDTYFHHGKYALMESKDFLDKHCHDIVTITDNYNFVCYSIDIDKLIKKGNELFSTGVNRRW
ncbi:AAC(3) family N-acetyltransferase [Vibrio owensii]|uniref:AAC(3) family N-acetyltransferase n=1 Tax=Vibrio owensii TaxID=696485 RepID=UPI0018F11804|nr:AAC(3) family N-acetyltransferase [Vibrio owensii]